MWLASIHIDEVDLELLGETARNQAQENRCQDGETREDHGRIVANCRLTPVSLQSVRVLPAPVAY